MIPQIFPKQNFVLKIFFLLRTGLKQIYNDSGNLFFFQIFFKKFSKYFKKKNVVLKLFFLLGNGLKRIFNDFGALTFFFSDFGGENGRQTAILGPISPIIELDLHFMPIYLYTKFEDDMPKT